MERNLNDIKELAGYPCEAHLNKAGTMVHIWCLDEGCLFTLSLDKTFFDKVSTEVLEKVFGETHKKWCQPRDFSKLIEDPDKALIELEKARDDYRLSPAQCDKIKALLLRVKQYRELKKEQVSGE